MRIQTILNRVEKFKSFVSGQARLDERGDGPALVVALEPRRNSRPYCSGCGRRGPAYDCLEERRFEFVPVSGGRGLPGLPDAASGLQPMWGDGRAGAGVRWQGPTNDDLPLVPFDLGQAAESERGRLDLPHVVG